MQDDLLISRRELLAVLFRHRAGILAILLTSLSIAAFSVYWLISPTYQSEATIIINTSYLTEPLRDAPPESDFEKLAYFHTQRDIISSERMAAEAVARIHLADHRVIGRIERIQNMVGDVKRWAGGILGIDSWTKPWSAEGAAIGAVHDGIKTFALPDSKALKVTLRAKDPKEAADTLGALLEVHNDYYYNVVRLKAGGAVGFLEAEFAKTSEDLQSAENTLFRLKKGDRVSVEGGRVSAGNGSSVLGVTDSAKIQDELKIYVLKLEEELRQAQQIPENERRERIVNDIQARMKRYVGTLNAVPEKELDLVRSKRQFDIAQDAYQLIQRNLTRARLVATGNTDRIRLVEVFQPPMLSEEVVFPQKRLVMVLALALGLVLGLTWAFVMDYLDHSFRSGRDIERYLGSRLIASVPRLQGR